MAKKKATKTPDETVLSAMTASTMCSNCGTVFDMTLDACPNCHHSQ